MASDRHYTAERAELASMYPGKKWVQKVMGMTDSTVHAVYTDILKKREKKRKESSGN